MLDEDLPMLEDGDMFIADRQYIVTSTDINSDGEMEEEEEITVTQE